MRHEGDRMRAANVPKSMTSSKQARVQKVCTLWTHDENFSRDDIVFNSEKFPELPSTPGVLLQIIAINPTTAVRDFSSTNKLSAHDASQSKAELHPKDGADVQSRKSRRGSFSRTIDENGSTIPGGHTVDLEKTYIFASKPLPHDLKAKHANLQISVAEKIAKVFGFRNRMQVVVTEVRIFAYKLVIAADGRRPTKLDMRPIMLNSCSATNILRERTCGVWLSQN